MHARYREGLTLAEVGAEFGVTRERVRQLFFDQRHDQAHPNGIPVEVSPSDGLEHRAAAVAADDVRGV
jgi:hypothetical protein